MRSRVPSCETVVSFALSLPLRPAGALFSSQRSACKQVQSSVETGRRFAPQTRSLSVRTPHRLSAAMPSSPKSNGVAKRLIVLSDGT